MNYLAGFILGAVLLTQGMNNTNIKKKRSIAPYLVTTRQGTEFETRNIRITPGFYFPEDAPYLWGNHREGELYLDADELQSTDFLFNARTNKEIWGYFDNGRRYVPLDRLAAIIVTDPKTLAVEDLVTGEKFSLSSGAYTFKRWQLEFVDLQGNRHQFAFADISAVIFPGARSF